jgi:hypothetical protein|tara:strand:- start:332 stop:715 length:384 start_codon:yes stop_codon:yes gene_type:complete
MKVKENCEGVLYKNLEKINNACYFGEMEKPLASQCFIGDAFENNQSCSILNFHYLDNGEIVEFSNYVPEKSGVYLGSLLVSVKPRIGRKTVIKEPYIEDILGKEKITGKAYAVLSESVLAYNFSIFD